MGCKTLTSVSQSHHISDTCEITEVWHHSLHRSLWHFELFQASLSMFVTAQYDRPLYFCSCSFCLLSSFFLACSLQSQIGCLPYFYTWCGLSANLECRSEMCCTRLAENMGCRTSPSAYHRTTLWGCIFTTKVCICISNREKTAVFPLHVLRLWYSHICAEKGR